MSRATPSAFTLVELLVVLAIIVILLGAIIGVASAVTNSAKARDTQALFQILELAVNQFQGDKPLAKVRGYAGRYANYPPDELEAFSNDPADGGIPETGSTVVSGDAQLEDDADGLLTMDDVEHRDTKAMALAIKLYSATSAAILERIDSRFRRLGRDPNDLVEYFDRDDANNDGAFREPLTYFVDSWGTPIEYYVTRVLDDSDPGLTYHVPSDDAPQYPSLGARRIASTAFVAANNGAPLFVSYGPDGEDQFAQDMMDSVGRTQLVWDFNDDYAGGGTVDRAINHRLNSDNVYSSEAIAEKLAAPLP